MADGNYARLVAACDHEKPLFRTSGRARKACFDCWPGAGPKERRPQDEKRCAGCGAGIAGRINYCGACRAVRDQRRNRRKRQSKPRALVCERCYRTTFRRVSGGERDAGRFCSRQCAASHHSLVAQEIAGIRRLGRQNHPRTRVFSGYCAACSAPVPVSRHHRKYCSNECRPPAYRPDDGEKQCRQCGIVFSPCATGGKRTDYCSEACRRTAGAPLRRIHRKAAKLRKRGVTVERVDPIKVFERDRWRCQLCGVKTPKSKRGTYADDAPELDHIVPLSKGGEHSYRNGQTACRRCNAEKGATVKGQLLLIG